MNVRIKKLHKDAVIPRYAKPGDAGMDLTATTKEFDDYGNISYGTGLAFEIPEGFVGYLFPRSSISKYNLSLTNSVGVIDSGYRGEVTLKFKPNSFYYREIDNDTQQEYEVGERVAQLIIMPVPTIQFTEVESLSDTERGDGGYGSSGK